MAVEQPGLWRLVEDVLKGRNTNLLAVAQVQKAPPGVAKLSKQKKRLVAVTGQLRLIVLTGAWDSEAGSMRFEVHSCKPAGNSYQVTKTYPLNSLVKVEVYQGEPGLLSNIQAVELSFSAWGAAGGAASLAFQAQDEEAMLQILAPVMHFSMMFPAPEQKQPGLMTYPDNNSVSLAVQMEAWVANHLDPNLERTLMSAQCGGTAGKDAQDPEEERGRLSLVSAKEERDLQALLDRFAFEVGDIEQFQQRLQDELAALEAANVHAILESAPHVERVRGSLDDALALLDDVNENLATFDTKLLVMREDIAAIEARNNRLELQTRNNGKLLNAVDGLLARLQLPPAVERALKTLQFNPHTLDTMVTAGWELYDHLEALSEPKPGADGVAGISRALGSMHAVADQRMRFAVLSRTYAQRASQYLGDELTAMTNAALQATATKHGAAKCSMPDHTELREEREKLASLLPIVRSLQPNILDTLGERYTSAVNTLLRKELRLYTSELRKMVAAAAAQLPAEPVILKGSRKEEAIALQSLSTHPSALSQTSSLPDTPNSLASARGPLSSRGLDSSRQDLGPFSAYAQLLQHWVPLLLAELDGCAEFLMLKEDATAPLAAGPGGHGGRVGSGQNGHAAVTGSSGRAASSGPTQIVAGGIPALEALLANLSIDFISIVDLVSKHQQLQAVPMLARTLEWQARLANRIVAAPLRGLLTQCSNRLLSNFERFVSDMAASVSRFEAKGFLHTAETVKGVHILPFLPNFVGIVGRLEELQDAAAVPQQQPALPSADFGPAEADEDEDEEGEPEGAPASDEESEGEMVREESLQISGLAAMRRGSAGPVQDSNALRRQLQGSLSGLRRAHRMGLKAMRRGQPSGIMETGDSQEEGSPPPSPGKRVLTEAEIPSHMPEPRLVTSARDLADPLYAILTRAMFQSIERISATDTKHGERLRLENYIFFQTALKGQAERNPVLAFFVGLAEENKQHSIQVYIQQQLEYGKMWRLVEFRQGLELLLQEVGAEEVPFQPGYQPTDFRNLLAAAMHHCEKRLSGVYSRIMKHLSPNTDLIDLVWRQLREKLEGSYGSLVQHGAALYPSVQIPQTPEALRALLITLG